MSRRKTHKYDLANELDNVVQDPKDFFNRCKGRWQSDYFKNTNPIVLELGCGRGEYAVGLAALFPNKNFIGIDVKGDRLASAGFSALTKDLKNVGFLRIQMQFILSFFNENEIDEIWITFPDPQPRDREVKKRLTFSLFLEKYIQVLKPNGLIHLKTDSSLLYEYSLESMANNGFTIIEQTANLYESELNKDHFGIKTRFEELFYNKGFDIKYIRAKNNKKEA